VIAPVVKGRPLLGRFAENRQALIRAHRQIAEAYQRKEISGSDAEWLLDNFHIVADTLEEIQTDLPRGYYQLLPKLAEGPLAGLPRIYALALELISHCDSCLDETNITHFVQAYQTVTPLLIGELWAIPIMCRLVVVENLRRLAEQIVQSRTDRHEAKGWAAHVLSLPERDLASSALHAAPPSLRPHSQWSDSFIMHLFELLREEGTALASGVEWLENFLAGRGRTATEVLRREQQHQAANQVSIGNCVTSLRLLSALDWSEFFERTSLVEAILREDPAGVYARQDFTTRDRYRRGVERLARGCGLHELDVARQVLTRAERGRDAEMQDRARREFGPLTAPGHRHPAVTPRSHVGYYLIDQGRRELEAALRYRPALHDRWQRSVLDHPKAVYLGGLTLVTTFLLLGLAACISRWGGSTAGVLLALLVALPPASEVAIGLVNYLITWLIPPRVLPKLHFRDGIPADCATFVVMPTMLVRPESAAALLERLEVHYLSNPDPQLRFALLTDFADAPFEHMPEDESYVQAALDQIETLNERYSHGGPDRFFLFHRRRLWNPVQGCWMGWERKRGKLLEFNRLLRGDRDTSFAVIAGDISQLPPIHYVITLDADTQLPREAAQRLIATLAHPLNQPCFDPAQHRVAAGYGILQPRISLSLPAARRSLFARIFAGSAGIDPYTIAVSDTYQDLFGIGSFTGKGIYDVDAFEAAVGHTFPDNHILSHDLIEGNYARCGLVTDIELLDEFPARYLAYARREHRWTRGDWQILDWLFPTVPGPDGRRQRNPLSAVERWKVFDNLRRSLLPPALVILLVLGWTVLPGPAWFWTGLVLLVLGWPLVMQLVSVPFRLLRDLFRGRWWGTLPENMGLTAGQVLLGTVFLAEQAYRMLDAVFRTLARRYLTRRNLLEWETAATTERRLRATLSNTCRSMWHAPALALILGLLVLLVRPEALLVAGPILVAWLVSPLVAFWISQPRRSVAPVLAPEDRRLLHQLARKTWSFFETFAGEEDHWLPPDNYQEDRKEPVAHRTSPTNVGFYLLSSLAAHDFGYLTLPALAERLEKTFATLAQLERSHGHFYNWYDTQTLRPLQPAYISTVDSGNLLASLLALKQGLLEKIKDESPGPSMCEGLADTLEQVTTALRSLEAPGDAAALELFQSLENHLGEIGRLLQEPPPDRPGWEEKLEQLGRQTEELTDLVGKLAATIRETPEALQDWARRFASLVRERQEELGTMESAGATLHERLQRLANEANQLATAMDFKMLYNEQRHLFSVGYNLSLGRLDNVHYDLLASEASLASFLAIARGDVPKRHWFQLGRPLTRADGSVALLSWGGTMFEYLMPRLLLASFPDTLLDESQRAAVTCQVEYGRQRRVPWGISESAFSAMDADLNYQYQAFGVPGLGFKRGLAKDLVIAPYATALAVVVCPKLAVRNFRQLAQEGGEGSYGFYEAIDYTPDRVQRERRPVVVKCFMAHHQGMSLVALTNALLNNPIPRRFHAEPMVRATELLLQERVSEGIPLVQLHVDEAALPAPGQGHLFLMSRKLTTPHTAHPRTHLISSGQYTVMVTNAGAGYSTCRGLDVTRWREDRTCDSSGQFCYVRIPHTGRVWSAGYQPVCRDADEYEVVYATDKAEFRRLDGPIETHLEVTVSPENHAEVRRLTLTNHGSKPQDLEVTSYAEVVLAPHAADLAHPAFGKLFLETEFVPAAEALLCRRRPRDPSQQPVWGVHVVAVDGPTVGPLQYETNRLFFLGRGRTPANPVALDPGMVLSGMTGPVLDPIFSLRRRVRVLPQTSVSIAFTTAVADSREEALALADHYHDFHGVARAFELAWAHTQVELRHLHLSAEEAHLYQRLAAHVIYASPTLRAAPSVLTANHQGQAGLWRHGISGDHPIVLVLIAEIEEMPLVREVLAAHVYWRRKGLTVDLVILNEHQTGYFEDLHQQLLNLVRSSDDRALADKPGGVFVRKAAHISQEDQWLLQAAARCVLAGNRGSLASQLDRLERAALPPERLPEKERSRVSSQGTRKTRSEARAAEPKTGPLLFANGLGGFSPDGREYVIQLPSAEVQSSVLRFPPAPWINVVSNPAFGFLASESGSGYTWADNSQANRLTPWNNDPVSDPPGEVVYLRDEATGEVWTAAPGPIPAPVSHLVRHGQGYTLFEQNSHGLGHELLLFVPFTDPIKLLCLKVRNLSRQPRRLSATFYAEWVLGTVREQASAHVVTEVDPESGALLARNSFNTDFAARVAFADVNLRPRTLTGDRTEFLGRNGSLTAPAALRRRELTGTVGAALDACAVLRTPFDLEPGEQKEIVFFLGEAGGVDEVRRLLRRYREPGQVAKAFEDVPNRWDQILTTIQVRTPNPALDLLLNRWLLYQVLSCRFWGRSAFYQSGGAYGFRDQLQDVMALVYAAPQEARAHILRAASRQFREGDVQHWWHSASGAGVRTRISDDYLWLPFVVWHYVTTTGDAAILDEHVAFLQAPLLRPEQEEDYRVPEVSEESATLYEHCVRAIEHGFRFGSHGLPVMGTGDWNDGMNRVGREGRGESVWNGWFLLTILRAFTDLAERRGDAGRAGHYRDKTKELEDALQAATWDGRWYRRAYFDDGSPLGSAENEECRIDSLPQSWAVIAGAADAQRCQQAIASVEEFLVREADKLILLFTPPFDKSKQEPGYIKGYVPGIRENGGQYTHAAAWVVQATALLGQGTRAMELFDLLNPIHHSSSPAEVEQYRVEPYVVAGDIYSESSHLGRGGWTWYTGSASWLYRVALETILGFSLRGSQLSLEPCIPGHWSNYEITYRYHSATYHITVANPQGVERGVRSVTVDNEAQEGKVIELMDDGRLHEVYITLG
jgi:cyclic beta-1,2-glucan synthetase